MSELKVTEERKKIIAEIIEIYKEGGNSDDIRKFLKEKKRTDRSIRDDLYFAHKQIQQDVKEEREILIRTHLSRYHTIYKRHSNLTLESPEIQRINPLLRKSVLIDHYNIAIDALIAKEKILGLHTRNFRLQLNNFYKKRILKSYNFNSKNFDDLVRLNELLKKMKVNNDQVLTYDDIDNELKEKTQDVEYIEINDQASDKIKETIKIKEKVKDQKEVIDEIKEKIILSDLEKHDDKRKSFLNKLKKL